MTRKKEEEVAKINGNNLQIENNVVYVERILTMK